MCSLLISLLSMALCASAPSSVPESASTQPTTDAVDRALNELFDEIVRPPAGSIEIAPGLAVVARFDFWDHSGDLKRPRRLGKQNPEQEPPQGLTPSDRRSYGITLLVYQTKEFKGGEFVYKEVFTLPAPTASWPDGRFLDLPEGAEAKTNISADGRQFTFEHKFQLKPGQIIPSVKVDDHLYIVDHYPPHEWAFDINDPAGEYRIQAFVNEKLVKSATFNVGRVSKER